MPPKKVEEPEKKPLIGRVGTNLKVGIVGIPNVGKSTFFNVLTKSEAAAENFPFCTIDPNEISRVPVPDQRFDYLVEYFKPTSKVPAFLNVVDIAGLVKGAAEGQGLGNAFLSHIKACDALFHLCRAFEAEDVIHIEGEVNPIKDMEVINEELRLKDEEYFHVNLEKLEKLAIRGGDKKLKPEYDTFLKIKTILVDEKKHIRFGDWSALDIEILNKHMFITTKPVIYLVNLSEKDYIRKKNKWLIKIKEWVDKNDPGAIIIPFSGVFENKIIEMEEPERKKYMEEVQATSALDKIIIQGYKALQLQYFFTAGHGEVKAWTIQKGSKAPQAAGRIHTDFEKGFIMAEVMKFEDFKNEGTEAACKAAGKYRQQGRNYVVEDGDIIFFKFNAGAGLKDPKKNKVPAFLNVVDIAGLVKGAAEGQGLGNAFLSHIKACDALFHLCRAFEAEDVIHIEGEVNPIKDMEVINEELRLKDEEYFHVNLEKLEKLAIRGGDKKLKPEYDTFLKIKTILVDEKKHIRFGDWSALDIEILNKHMFITTKPVIYLVNLSEKDYIRKKNKWLIKIKEWVDKNDPGAIIIPFSGVFENKIIEMEEPERKKYMEEVQATSALDKIIIQGYKALQLQYFFTAGHGEVKAWTIQKGSKAPQAAGRIHTDFEKGFIMAEVMKFEDFKNEGTEAACKAAGKYRQQGRNYVVEDGDIIFFKFNAGAGLKDPKKK